MEGEFYFFYVCACIESVVLFIRVLECWAVLDCLPVVSGD
jgi:hypothetical protein